MNRFERQDSSDFISEQSLEDCKSDDKKVKKLNQKAIIENLDMQRQNLQLQLFITEKLDQMMIEYNPGLIMKLTFTEKLKLKEQLDQICMNESQIHSNKDKYKLYKNMHDQLPQFEKIQLQKVRSTHSPIQN